MLHTENGHFLKSRDQSDGFWTGSKSFLKKSEKYTKKVEEEVFEVKRWRKGKYNRKF